MDDLRSDIRGVLNRLAMSTADRPSPLTRRRVVDQGRRTTTGCPYRN